MAPLQLQKVAPQEEEGGSDISVVEEGEEEQNRKQAQGRGCQLQA